MAWLGKSAWTAASNALVEAESGGKEFVLEAVADDRSSDDCAWECGTEAKQQMSTQQQMVGKIAEQSFQPTLGRPSGGEKRGKPLLV